MPATVDATTDAERETDAEAAAENSAITRNYAAMLAAINGLLAEMHEERRRAEVSRKVVDAEHNQEPATAQHSVWAEAHAALQK